MLSLPKITKTSKSQTVPSYQRRNSVTNIEDKAKVCIPCSKSVSTVKIRSFRTDTPGQTVQTQIRLLLRVYMVCHSVCSFWTQYSTEKQLCLNFRAITAIFSGVQIFRSFTVYKLLSSQIVALSLFQSNRDTGTQSKYLEDNFSKSIYKNSNRKQ